MAPHPYGARSEWQSEGKYIVLKQWLALVSAQEMVPFSRRTLGKGKAKT